MEQAWSLLLVQVHEVLGSAYAPLCLLCLPLLPGTRSQLGNDTCRYGIPDRFLHYVQPLLATILRHAESPSSLNARERS